ncbi:hypothetical protein [Sphingomonas mollis]|uniref:Uncharacterized protein n=1 Tax=Sphingomonas mollis TaxID=2795726 RepID=A0ABS0XSQ9_9SPHN|nr:hypothetical protein [Sphingomonas sp. BT553]MBJ6123067.1 hypothetical protein [Sphingomonas sp. BT553]
MVRVSFRIVALVASFLSLPVAAQEMLSAPASMVPAVAVIDDAAPMLPAGASPNFEPPVADGAGGYLTPNRGLSAEETTWHLRVALNVAALGCRGAAADQLIDGYNALLTMHKATLATITDAVAQRYKARFGANWQAYQDDAMTRLYNFWALPPAKEAFCAAALGVIRDLGAIAPDALPAFAATALPRLEAPMLAFFVEFDRYRIARTAWQARHAPASVMIAAQAAPVQIASVRVGVGEP